VLDAPAAPPDFLDTNILLRYLTRDHPVHSELARQLIERLQTGAATVVTSETVIVEAVIVLASPRLYALPRAEIREHLRGILLLPGLVVEHKGALLRALDIHVAVNMDFGDALSVAHMERLGIRRINSFDRGFDRIAGIERIGPSADE
jgi:predicted nucleic acid-binding protein